MPSRGAHALLLGFIAAVAAVTLLGIATMGPSQPAASPADLLQASMKASFGDTWQEWYTPLTAASPTSRSNPNLLECAREALRVRVSLVVGDTWQEWYTLSPLNPFALTPP